MFFYFKKVFSIFGFWGLWFACSRFDLFLVCSGHGSFSNDPKLNSVVGHILHSSILVPYHGWYVSVQCLMSLISVCVCVFWNKNEARTTLFDTMLIVE